MISLYKNIKKYRLENGWTQTQLAEKVGYSDKSMISKIEKGEVDLSQSQIWKFADAFGITASELFGSIESYEEDDNQKLNDLIDTLPPDDREQIKDLEKQLVRLTPEERTNLLNLLRSLLPDA